MSTYWGLHCKTCNSSTGCGERNGHQKLESLLFLAPYLKKLFEMEAVDTLEIRLFGYWEDHDQPIYWVTEHYQHNVVLYNEYGHEEEIYPP